MIDREPDDKDTHAEHHRIEIRWCSVDAALEMGWGVSGFEWWRSARLALGPNQYTRNQSCTVFATPSSVDGHAQPCRLTTNRRIPPARSTSAGILYNPRATCDIDSPHQPCVLGGARERLCVLYAVTGKEVRGGPPARERTHGWPP